MGRRQSLRAGQGGGEVAKRPRSNRFQCAAAMKSFLLKLFTWWNSQTFGTQFWTWMYGEAVGEDEFGNRYFRTSGGKIDKTLGFERRWVIYNGYAEASTRAALLARLAASHRRHAADAGKLQAACVAEAAPAEYDRHARRLGRPGSTLAAGRRPKATGDYKAWNPGQPS